MVSITRVDEADSGPSDGVAVEVGKEAESLMAPADQARPYRAVGMVLGQGGLPGPLGAMDFASFRGACRKPISPILNRPGVHHTRAKRIHGGPVRRSSRIRSRTRPGPGTSIKQQQKTLIMSLGVAREGEVIGDAALQAYLDLFARPLSLAHIEVIVSLFVWQPDALPLVDDSPLISA